MAKTAFDSIESKFIFGLASSDPAVRAKFLKLFNSRAPASLPDRLRVVIQDDRWRLSSHRFWLKNALDLLLVLVQQGQPLWLAPNTATAPPLLVRRRPPPPPSSRGSAAGDARVKQEAHATPGTAAGSAAKSEDNKMSVQPSGPLHAPGAASTGAAMAGEDSAMHTGEAAPGLDDGTGGGGRSTEAGEALEAAAAQLDQLTEASKVKDCAPWSHALVRLGASLNKSKLSITWFLPQRSSWSSLL